MQASPDFACPCQKLPAVSHQPITTSPTSPLPQPQETTTMSLRRPPIQILQGLSHNPRCLPRPKCHRQQPPSLLRKLTTKAPKETPHSPLDPITLHRLQMERIAYYKRRTYYSAAGCLIGMLCIWVTATSIPLDPSPTTPQKADSNRRGRGDFPVPC